MTPSASWVDAVVSTIASRWDGAPDALPDVAIAALDRAGLPDVDELVAAVLAGRVPLPTPVDPERRFGQPGVTVGRGPGFAIDLYFWTRSESAVHDHPFAGVYTVLRGSSVEARYAFEVSESFGRVRVGRLHLTELEAIAPGRIVPFSPVRHPLVHALIHVPIPTVSMVVRSIRTEGYHRYLAPGLALRIDGASADLATRLALLDHLRTVGDPSWETRLTDLVATQDLEGVVLALSSAGPGPAVERSLEVARSRFGAVADTVEAALRAGRKRHHDWRIRDRFDDEADRFVATVLALAETRSAAVRLLRDRFADQTTPQLLRWLRASGLFSEDDPGETAAAWLAADPLPPEFLTPASRAELRRYFGGSILESLLP